MNDKQITLYAQGNVSVKLKGAPLISWVKGNWNITHCGVSDPTLGAQTTLDVSAAGLVWIRLC